MLSPLFWIGEFFNICHVELVKGKIENEYGNKYI